MDLLFHRSVTPPPDFPELVSFDLVSPRGALTTWTTTEDAAALAGRQVTGSGSSFPQTRTSSPVRVAVCEHADRDDRLTVLEPVETTFIRTQTLPDGFLVVGARCRWTSEHIENNAVRFDRTGNLIQKATFGDGIQHVASAADGMTWVGYFDEGVFGNFGWGGPGPEPVGAHGINCFDASLQLKTHAVGRDISDCYAMNVLPDCVYACCYADWDIVRIDPEGRQTNWKNSISGATNLVVAGDTLAHIGGYDAIDRVVVGTLSEGGLQSTRTERLTLNGGDLPPKAILSAREHTLHALVGNDWYVGDLPC